MGLWSVVISCDPDFDARGLLADTEVVACTRATREDALLTWRARAVLDGHLDGTLSSAPRSGVPLQEKASDLLFSPPLRIYRARIAMVVVAGLDEAGCGPAFGDLVAAACVLPSESGVAGLADSKKLTPKRRRALYAQITERCGYGLGVVSNAEIDARGLAWARRAVFHRALDDLVERTGRVPDSLVVDGTLFEPWRGVPYECVPRADATVPCVSGASILAKVTRDASIDALCDAHPELDERYGLRSNKGYLAPKHLEGLRAHGRTRWHRHSYHIRGL